MNRGPARFDPNDVLDCMRTDLVAAGTEAKARVTTRLAASIAGLAWAAKHLEGDDTIEPLPDDDPHLEALGEPAQPSSLLSVVPQSSAANARWLTALLHHPGRWSLAMFSAGALCGAGIHAAVVRLANPTVATAADREPSNATNSHGASEAVDVGEPSSGSAEEGHLQPGTSVPLETAVPTEPQAMPAVRARTGAGTAASLAAQQALLDEARAALARGDNGAALRGVELHARRYPESIMIEEREALAIKALVGKGRYAEARARGDRFRARFPRSLLLPSINETLEPIP